MQINYCLIGITLFFSGIYMSFQNRNTEHFRRFYNLLNDTQKEKYESIVRERLLIYIGGALIGLGLAYYYYSTHNSIYFYNSLLFYKKICLHLH